MPLVRGPFDIKWGDNTLVDIEEVDVEYEQDSEDFQTLAGRTLEVDGPQKVNATLTLLASDIPALAVLLPQNFVENGGVMSTGETVANADGAIDVVPRACDASLVFNNLDIISCGSPANVLRIVNARTRLEGIEIDNKIQKIMIKIIGESVQGEATIQQFIQGTINVVS